MMLLLQQRRVDRNGVVVRRISSSGVRFLWITLVLLCFIVLGTTVSEAAKTKKRRKKKSITLVNPNTVTITNSLRNICGNREPPITTKADEKRLKWLVAGSGEGSLLLSSSPQNRAACWILFKDKQAKKRGDLTKYLQRYAVAVLHYATTKSNTTAWDWPMAADDPKAVMNHGNWMNPTLHECNWYGVVCTTFTKIITELNLGFLKLDGLIPREMSLLTGLVDIDFHGNDFQGVVPHRMVDSLSNLQYLRLHMNGFFGSIHREIVGMTQLRELNLFGNYFAGRIPSELAELSKLEVIDLYANQLSGRIPTELGSLKKLRYLDVHDNNLTGKVPTEICKNKHIKELIADCLGPKPEVQCDCCTVCCRGLPDFKCVNQKTGQEIRFGR